MSAAEDRALTGRPPASKRGWRGLLWKSLRALFFVLAAVAFTYCCVRVGLLPDFELVALDMRSRANLPLKDSPVRIVYLSDEDFEGADFNQETPLNPAAVQRVISVIAQGNPSVIGVDLVTDAPAYAGYRPPEDWPPIVWARIAHEDERTKRLLPRPVLGGQQPPPCWGLAEARADYDGLLRHYRRTYDRDDLADPRECDALASAAQNGGGKRCAPTGCPFPSFAWALFKEHLARAGAAGGGGRAANGTGGHEEGGHEEGGHADGPLAIRLTRQPSESSDRAPSGRSKISVRELFDIHRSDQIRKVNTLKALFENKIVLFGGAFRAARDEHETPLGTMYGVEVIAQILDTEVVGGGIPHPNWPAVFLILVFENLLLVGIFEYFHHEVGRSSLVSLLVIPPVALLCSRLAFGSWMLWAFFIPILLIGLVHELYLLAQRRKGDALGGVIRLDGGAVAAAHTAGHTPHADDAAPATPPRREPPAAHDSTSAAASPDPDAEVAAAAVASAVASAPAVPRVTAGTRDRPRLSGAEKALGILFVALVASLTLADGFREKTANRK